MNGTFLVAPNITALDRDLEVTLVSLDNPITLMLSFPVCIDCANSDHVCIYFVYLVCTQPAQSCNPNFTISNYSLLIPSMSERVLLNENIAGINFIMASMEIPGLERDRIFEVFIEACIEINCRRSGARTLSKWLNSEEQ